MKIRLTLTYVDLELLINYTNTLIEKLDKPVRINYVNKVLAARSVTNKAQRKAQLHEIMMLHQSLNQKQFNWPLIKRYKTHIKINLTLTQGYILWVHYNIHDNTHPISINDKINVIIKHLTH